jgi:hypothetical protein
MNNILNKIAQMERNAAELQEVQLAKHEVELALVDDVQNLYNAANKSYKANTDQLMSFASKMESSFQKTADEYKKALDKYNQLEKMSKDLGVPLPNEISKLKGLIEFGLNDSLDAKSNAVKIAAI